MSVMRIDFDFAQNWQANATARATRRPVRQGNANAGNVNGPLRASHEVPEPDTANFDPAGIGAIGIPFPMPMTPLLTDVKVAVVVFPMTYVGSPFLWTTVAFSWGRPPRHFFLGLRFRRRRDCECETKRGNDRKDDGNLLQHFLVCSRVNEAPQPN
jgi:hypothetical protein